MALIHIGRVEYQDDGALYSGVEELIVARLRRQGDLVCATWHNKGKGPHVWSAEREREKEAKKKHGARQSSFCLIRGRWVPIETQCSSLLGRGDPKKEKEANTMGSFSASVGRGARKKGTHAADYIDEKEESYFPRCCG